MRIRWGPPLGYLPVSLESTCIRVCLAAALALTALPAAAQDRVPTPLALQVMLRVLAYDRNFDTHGTGDFVIIVAVEPRQGEAKTEAMPAMKALEGAAIHGRQIRFVTAELHGEQSLRESVQKQGASALLLLPGLSHEGLNAAAAVARAHRLYTLSLDPALVEQSLALGIANKDGRPQIVLNLAAAKDANAEFDVAVLKLARLIR